MAMVFEIWEGDEICNTELKSSLYFVRLIADFCFATDCLSAAFQPPGSQYFF